MSYPGSFFHDDGEEKEEKPSASLPMPDFANLSFGSGMSITERPAKSRVMEKQLFVQFRQTQRSLWPSSTSSLQAVDASQDVQGPRGSRLQVKRIDEVFDPVTASYKVQEGFEDSQKKIKVEILGEYLLALWRRITPSLNPKVASVIETSIEIKSNSLKRIGEEIVGNYLGTVWNNSQPRVGSNALIAYLPKLKARAEEMAAKEDPSENESSALEQLNFLIDFLNDEFADQINEINTLLSLGEITFNLLWAILLPKIPLYTECPLTGEPRIVWLQNAMNRLAAYELPSESVEYNINYDASGKRSPEPRFGIANVQQVSPIDAFGGAMKICELPTYPLEYHPHPEKLMESLRQRGKKWESLQGIRHMHYTGTAHYQTPTGQMAKLQVDSRVMIDRKTLEEMNPNFPTPKIAKDLRLETLRKNMAQYTDGPVKNYDDDTSLNEEQLSYTSPILYGFSLTDKRWLLFNVEDVKTFEWNDDPFDNLVLPPETKDLVRVLVKEYMLSEMGLDDFVHGKGKGLVINLFGSPGVGKTLTAEATSEHVRKPLYVAGAADLGTDARSLDRKLTRIFTVSAKWGAVVLIDEADVFLEERSLHDLERNAMVAVFLRQLEYFRGIIFLTTNRVRTFDEAFLSRIHVSLRYPELDSSAKRHIWVAFIKKAHESKGVQVQEQGGLSQEELNDLGEKDVNGRQIKNVVRTATAVANDKGELLGYKHLVKVLEILERFELDWNAVKHPIQ